jgi:phage terminase large subunit-like protein
MTTTVKKVRALLLLKGIKVGQMVEETLSHARKNLPVVTTFSTQDKLSRAMPVAILYEQGRVFHTRVFNELEEEQMVTFDGTGKSPNRLDAMVFAMNHLMATNKNVTKIVEFLF